MSVTLEDAPRVIAAAEKRADELGQPDTTNHGRVAIFAGGVPLSRDGKVVGAVGVSGGTGELDEAVAEAGAAAF